MFLFSLRRARLGCDDPPSSHSTPPIDKKKIIRPSSAGASSTRKTPLASTKCHQSADGGSPRSNNAQNGQKGGGSSGDFSRNDGGRFSLRIPRSGSTSVSWSLGIFLLFK